MNNYEQLISLTFISANDLSDRAIWGPFLMDLECCLGAKLSHLDNKDPIRRKMADIPDVEGFICDFGERESSRWLHGKFDRKFGRENVTITIALFKKESRFPCSVDIYLPNKILENGEGLESIREIFGLCNKHLQTFYGYGDIFEQVIAKGKATRSAVNIEAELVGLFWLTYLNDRYVDYFGREKVRQLPNAEPELCLEGVTLQFGELPGTEKSIAARAAAQELLGSEHFVDPTLTYDKLPGRHALRLEELRS